MSMSVLRRFLKSPVALGSVLFLLLVALLAVLAPIIAPHDPNAIDVADKFAGPSAEHLLGTDQLGRDLLSRLIFGSRVSIEVSFAVVFFSLMIAVPIGLVSGYWSGKVDLVLMRLVDAALSVPALVLALAVAGTLGPGVFNTILALTVISVPGFIRVVRGATLAVREESFIEASRTIGTPTYRLMWSRVLPNVRSPLIVYTTFALAGTLLAEAGLSFLGLSARPPAATWGNMLRGAYDYALFTHSSQLFIPGLAIATTVFALNAIGDRLSNELGLSPVREFDKRECMGLTIVDRPGEPAIKDQANLGRSRAQLDVRDLSVAFTTNTGVHRVVENVSFSIAPGQVLGLVGESGAGKSVTSLAISRLLPSPQARIVGGQIVFDGTDLLGLDFEGMRQVRGAGIGMVFQDPMTSLDPAFTIGHQLVEAQRAHSSMSKGEARAGAMDLLEMVRVPAAASRMAAYPHELSGGTRQRVMLALALAGRPKLLIADEATTALDVTVQAQILQVLRDLQRELGMAMLFVTHDLGVVADMCDMVSVMYGGQIVESASVDELFHSPAHPYTEGLLQAVPQLGRQHERLPAIAGQPPRLDMMPSGCRFAARCPYAGPGCDVEVTIKLAPSGHGVRCVKAESLVLDGVRV